MNVLTPRSGQLPFLGLNISATEFLAYYQGAARHVVTQSLDGRTLQFPANILRPYVTHEGIDGVFALVYGADSKFLEIKRVEGP